MHQGQKYSSHPRLKVRVAPLCLWIPSLPGGQGVVLRPYANFSLFVEPTQLSKKTREGIFGTSTKRGIAAGLTAAWNGEEHQKNGHTAHVH